MVSQTNLETLKKKDLEKQDEKLIKILMGLPLEITTPSNTLIPQITMTNIIVFPFKIIYTADLHMRPQRHQTNNTTMHHNIRPNGGARDLSLHKAASCGDVARAQEVVQNRRDVLSLSDEEGNLPLHLAAQKGHKQVVTFLVNAYPQGSYALNHSRVSPLYYAVQCKDLELVEYMFCKLDKDYDDVFHSLVKGKSIVRVAIGDNNQAMLESIVKHQPDLIKWRDEEGLTPLSFAASKGYIDIASYILQLWPESIKISNEDKTMTYPIHQATLGGHVEILKLFHNYINKFPQLLGCLDRHGQTALHLAAKQRRNKLKSVVSYLLSLDEGRKLLEIEDENRNTPLDLAKNKGNREVEQEIISNL